MLEQNAGEYQDTGKKLGLLFHIISLKLNRARNDALARHAKQFTAHAWVYSTHHGYVRGWQKAFGRNLAQEARSPLGCGGRLLRWEWDGRDKSRRRRLSNLFREWDGRGKSRRRCMSCLFREWNRRDKSRCRHLRNLFREWNRRDKSRRRHLSNLFREWNRRDKARRHDRGI